MNWIKIEPGMELPQENVIAWYPNWDWSGNGGWCESSGLVWGNLNGKSEAFGSGEWGEPIAENIVSHYLVIESP